MLRCLLSSALLGLALCSCSTVEVTRFHSLPAKGEAKLFYIQPMPEQTGIEFNQYADRIAAGLTKYGWTRVRSSDLRHYVVMFDYGVTEPHEHTGTSPVYGQIGGGTTTHTGSFSGYAGGYSDRFRGTYSGTSYTPPRYGVVGESTYTYIRCGRWLVVSIHDKRGEVFDGSVVSVGRSPVLADVMPSMIDALFTGFPGKSGKRVNVTKPNS